MIKTPLSTVIGGVGMYTKNSLIIGGGKTELPFDPASLFKNGEQGFWLDPNDLSTMFQDSAGTIPVTGAGQPVGLMLDKSKGLSVGSNVSLISTAEKTTDDVQYITLISNTSYAFKWFDVELTISSLSSPNAIFIEGTLGGTLVYFTNLSLGTNKIKILAGSSGVIRFGAVSSSRYNIPNITVKEATGNHAYQTTSASRPILRQNATTSAYYLEFDGSDDFLQTSNIDFTATDKMSLFAGVRKLSDATLGTLVELSSSSDSVTNLGSFILGAPYASVGYGFQVRGNADRGGRRTLGTAPTSDVVTGFLDLTKNTIALAIRPFRNGVQEATSFGGVGGFGGNFGDYTLYIGRRSGTLYPFNGHLYGLIGIGKLASDNETAAIEKELAKRTGVTLNV